VAGAYAKLKTPELRDEYDAETRANRRSSSSTQGAQQGSRRQHNFKAEVPMADAFAMFSTVFAMANAARQAGVGAGAGSAASSAAASVGAAAAASVGAAAAASMMGGGGLDDLTDVLKACEGLLGGRGGADADAGGSTAQGASQGPAGDVGMGQMMGAAGLAFTALSATGGSSRLRQMQTAVQVVGVAAALLSKARARNEQQPQ
jgi:hypothetical protein